MKPVDSFENLYTNGHIDSHHISKIQNSKFIIPKNFKH